MYMYSKTMNQQVLAVLVGFYPIINTKGVYMNNKRQLIKYNMHTILHDKQ